MNHYGFLMRLVAFLLIAALGTALTASHQRSIQQARQEEVRRDLLMPDFRVQDKPFHISVKDIEQQTIPPVGSGWCGPAGCGGDRPDPTGDIASGPGPNNNLITLFGLFQEDAGSSFYRHKNTDRRPVVSDTPGATFSASLAYNRPDYLRLNDPTPIQVVLALDAGAPPDPAARIEEAAPGKRQTRKVSLPEPHVTAELRGDDQDFGIVPKGRQSRLVTAPYPAIWTWHVSALRPGEAKELTVEILAYPDGIDEPGHTIEVFTETFPIDARFFDHVVLFANSAKPVMAYWPILAGLVAGGWAVFTFRRQRKDAA